jgi:O-antigen ligase
MTVMFFIVFGFSLNDMKMSQNKITIKNIFFALVLFIVLYCLIFSYSRGGWLGFIFGSVILSLFLIRNNQYKYISLLIFVLILLFIAILCSIPQLRERTFAIFKGGDTSRIETWSIAIAMFKESPLLGKGLGTFLKHLPSYSNIYNQYAHNSYLQLLVESGVVGLTPFLFIIWHWLTKSISFIKLNKENFIFLGIFCGLCAFIMHAFFDNQLFSVKLATLFWLLLGMSVSFIYGKNN